MDEREDAHEVSLGKSTSSPFVVWIVNVAEGGRMQVGRNGKLVKSLGAAVAAALLAVPVAQARLADVPNQGAVQKVRPVVRTDARHAALLNGKNVRVEIVQPKVESTTIPAGQSAGTDTSSAIDWSDAGIGAGSTLALVLLAGGGILVTRRKLVGV
jgi:hypothetical protein